MEPIYSLIKPLVKAKVLSRPSKHIKSPYLADVLLLENNKEALCHTASLGCCGYIALDSIVWILEKEDITTKSTHELYLVEVNKVFIGCHPLVANKIVKNLLYKQKILPNINDIRSEISMNDCRFDFIAKYNERMTFIEVKSVPIVKNNIAIFPYKNEKVSKDPISPRALKHVETLTNLVNTYTCVLVYLIQRPDVNVFSINKLDPIYYNAVKKAFDAGVIIKPIVVRWDTQHCYYEKELGIVW